MRTTLLRNHRNALSLILFNLALGASISSAAEIEGYEYKSDAACTSVRLDRAPHAMSTLPVRNQGGTGMCSGFTASQLIDSWRLSKDPNAPHVSPLSLAVLLGEEVGKQQVNGVPVLDVMEKLQHVKPCNFKEIGDNFGELGIADFTYLLVRNYQMVQKSPERLNEGRTNIQKVLGGASLKPSKPIDDLLIAPHWTDFLARTLSSSCRADIDLSRVPKFRSVRANNIANRLTSRQVIARFIHHRLDDGTGQPLGISYCRSVLSDPDSNGVSSTGQLNTTTCKGEVHASVIVGRRLASYREESGKVETICQLLVRDSFGPSCAKYPDDSKTTPSARCENGQVWVDEDALVENTAEAFYLSEQK